MVLLHERHLDGLETEVASSSTTGDLPAKAFLLSVGAAVLLGAAVRAWPVIASDFPLNDGGLFYAMTRELQAAHYLLPETVSYNGLRIPFAYPPLGFYAAGLVAEATGSTLFDLLRFVPLAISTLCVAAFAALARSLLGSRAGAAAATFAFAVLPRSFLWLIMGGGLTRSFGMLFALLALYQAHAMLTRRTRRHVVFASIFVALTLLSHLEMATFLAASLVLMTVCHGRSRFGLARAISVSIGALALSSPWWITVVAHHGLSPFLAASQSRSTRVGEVLAAYLSVVPTQEPLFPVLAVLGLIGCDRCLTQRRFFLPAWVAVLPLVDPRAVGTDAAVPAALLAGIAVTEVLLPLFRAKTPSPGPVSAAHRWAEPAVLGLLLAYATFGASLSGRILDQSLGSADREAMQWVASHTPVSSSFLVISSGPWAQDRSSEWFPVLAERRSLATPQGTEWLPDHAFSQQLLRYEGLQACAGGDGRCIDRWADTERVSFDYVYVTKQPDAARVVPGARDFHWALEYALRADPRYRLVYDGLGAAIFERRANAAH